jgi:transcription elongation factor Elf1
MITATMTTRELVRAIKARRECPHTNTTSFLLHDPMVTVVKCDDCGLSARLDAFDLMVGLRRGLR